MELIIRLVLPRPVFTRTQRTLLGALLALTLALLPALALASDVFGDVPGTLPQHDAINRVYAAGIMRACTAGTPPNFCPNDPVLRAQQASQWDRALGLNGTPNAAVYVGRSRNTDISTSYRLPGPALVTVDGVGDVGQYASITIGVDGLGLISYYDLTNGDLKVAHCANAACTSAATATLDSGGNVGPFTSVAVGADGRGLISYYDATPNFDLKVAHCVDVICSAAVLTTLDTGGTDQVGVYTSITIGSDGLGLISYYDASNGDLKLAHCTNADCSSAVISALDTAGQVGLHSSIAIGQDGLGLISYHDSTNGDLKVAHCTNADCSSATLTALDSDDIVGLYSSIAVGADDFGLISYHSFSFGSLKVAHCENVACSSATISTITGGGVGYNTSIAIGVDGLGLISYGDSSDLEVAHCANVSCSAATLTTVDGPANRGSLTSITIGADGLGVVSYYDFAPNWDLKVAHCANVACTPFYRSSR